MAERRLTRNFILFVFYLIPSFASSGCGVGLDTRFPGGSQPFLLWPMTVEDGASGDTIGYDGNSHGITIDSSGNVYVSYYTTQGMDGQTEIGTRDYFITKYAQGGVRQWTVQDGASGATVTLLGSSISVDPSGNIYVAGNTSKSLDGQTMHGTTDFFISKYNPNGVRQWTIEDGYASVATQAFSVAVDSSGNAYAVGQTFRGLDGQTQHGSTDVFITKYNSNGTRQWTVQDGASGAVVQTKSIIVDSSGNIEIMGTVNASLDGQPYPGGTAYFISQYTAGGTRNWTVEDGAGTALYSQGQNIAADSSGNIYVVEGSSQGFDGHTLIGAGDLVLTQYNSTGVRQWTVEDGTPGVNGGGSAVVVDSSGKIDIVGNVQGGGFDGNSLLGTQDYFITQYNSSGVRQWTREDGVSGTSVTGAGITADIFNNLYVFGTTTSGIDGNTLIGTSDYFITQYSPSGVRE